jgi:hypothetical protein
MAQFPVLKEMLLEFDDDMFSGVKQVMSDTNHMWGKKDKDDDNNPEVKAAGAGEAGAAEIDKKRKAAASKLNAAKKQILQTRVKEFVGDLFEDLNNPSRATQTLMLAVDAANKKAASLTLHDIGLPVHGKIALAGKHLLLTFTRKGFISEQDKQHLLTTLNSRAPAKLTPDVIEFFNKNSGSFSRAIHLDDRLGLDYDQLYTQLYNIVVAGTKDAEADVKKAVAKRIILGLVAAQRSCMLAVNKIEATEANPDPSQPPATP